VPEIIFARARQVSQAISYAVKTDAVDGTLAQLCESS
jgi:hypothetical protein